MRATRSVVCPAGKPTSMRIAFCACAGADAPRHSAAAARIPANCINAMPDSPCSPDGGASITQDSGAADSKSECLFRTCVYGCYSGRYGGIEAATREGTMAFVEGSAAGRAWSEFPAEHWSYAIVAAM